MNFNKLIGSTMMVMGTLIGGGILALPMVGAGAGFLSTTFIVVFMWILMIITGFLFLEVNLAFKTKEVNFISMAYYTLGNTGRVITFISYIFLLYALVAAYIAGGGSLLTELLKLINIYVPSYVSSMVFVIVLGSVVFHGVKAVDYLNRSFLSLKAFFLVLSVILLMPHIDVANIINSNHHFKYILAGSPIFLCSFGYHILIPILAKYLGYEQKKTRLVIFLGTFLTLLIYMFWLFVTLGIVSIDNFIAFLNQKGSTGEFISMIMGLTKSKWANFALNGFVNITVTTSFLGVSLGLFDFLSDAFKRPKTTVGKLQTTFLTFFPPVIFALFYPKGFILALGYAAIAVAFSHVMLPAWMVYKLRKKKIKSPYRVWGGTPLLVCIFMIGLVLIVIQILSNFNLLPTI
ncbi:MAG: tyrosine-specific transport protein [Chlamydiae bacterium]|nr:tyrosine-specific transport protein [Chlamydiota bacterium]